jgi:GH15 family glucan-1,4-alpha-glucosidase
VRIEDYALIGDLQTAALVGRDGSIDWLCVPRFDSGACFASLLGDERHGRWLLTPAGEVTAIRRRYRSCTLVLETEMDTAEGTVRIVDFMPPRGRYPDIVRIVEGVRGQVPMRMQLVIRFDYGTAVPWVRRRSGGLTAIAGPDALVLRTPVATRGQDFTTVATSGRATGCRSRSPGTPRTKRSRPPSTRPPRCGRRPLSGATGARARPTGGTGRRP